MWTLILTLPLFIYLLALILLTGKSNPCWILATSRRFFVLYSKLWDELREGVGGWEEGRGGWGGGVGWEEVSGPQVNI